ncbi:hypothetical protein ABZ896_06695 [Streptomyces sp. NPDC047072]|uniref:hypothetical protein n=1 Tax=Streptomyces sp. NPDC047072 TaxID=3154809 RepID=UPI0033D57ECE
MTRPKPPEPSAQALAQCLVHRVDGLLQPVEVCGIRPSPTARQRTITMRPLPGRTQERALYGGQFTAYAL